MKRYNPKEIEPKWQQTWESSGIYKATEDPLKPKRYVLEYFPYPSDSAMHVGHVRNYTIGDAVARFHRMQGENVLHTMGWDSFGLPAENYAIKNNVSPKQAIAENTQKFKQQLIQMGFSYDWSREIDSSSPEYYRWTQYFFKLLFDRGLAYQKNSLQWWCETDKTVLANEQVESGKCWRCGNEVTKKPLKQWFFKITDYADRLVEDLEDLDWSDAIKSMQTNWIGKSTGAEIDFKLVDIKGEIKVFTTRPDTLFGVTFMVLAPEHELVQNITTDEQKKAVNTYIKMAQSKSDVERQETDREKTGVFTGAYAINPVNHEKVPVWIADYVLTGYGTGAIMAVPGHDDRDNEFATKFNLPVTYVVEPTHGQPQGDETFKKSVYVIVRNPKTNQAIVLDWGPRKDRHGGKMLIGGGVEGGEDFATTATREITEETGYKNFKLVKEADFQGHGYFYSNTKNKNMQVSGKGILFDLIDEEKVETNLDEGEIDKFKVTWQPIEKIASMLDDGIHEAFFRHLVLGECYHGEGIMINSGKYDGISSSEAREKIIKDLTETGIAEEKVNYKIRDWLISRQRYWGAPIPIIHCKKDGAVPVPEDQLPVELPEVESYQPNDEGTSVLASVHDWVNTTCPKCGGPAKRETDTMDGFACSSWYFLRFADPHNDKEPFSKERAKFWLPVDDYIGGAEHAVMHLLYSRMWTKVMFDAGMIDFDEPFKALRNHGMILAPDGRKMSKSWGNVIAPGEIIEQGYGADAIRLMELFIGPWNQEAAWSVEGMGGCFRFLQRLWTIAQEFIEAPESSENVDQNELLVITHKTIKKVSEDLHTMSFNTAIATLMAMVNDLYKIKKVAGFKDYKSWELALKTLTQLIAPFAPHIAEELWADLGETESVHISHWPVHNEEYLITDTMKIVVQVNGKVRATLEVSSGATEDQIVTEAKSQEKVATYLSDNQIKKTIYVPKKLVNFVV